MSFSYIIPFKFTQDRLLTLKKVLSNLQDLDCEIIIVEQGVEPILPATEIISKERYIFLENHLPFNKSWALNVAWKSATHDRIVFGDADNLMSTDKIISSLSNLDNFEFVSPHVRLIDLSENENQMHFEKIFEINRFGRGETDHQKLPMCGAMTMFTKSALEKIAGWPEEFFGWGAEDDAMSIKVKHFLKWIEIDNNCYHLYHQRVVPNQQFYMRNLQIYHNYINASKDQLGSYIDSIRSIVGDKNRKFT